MLTVTLYPSMFIFVGEEGIEPSPHGPKPCVLAVIRLPNNSNSTLDVTGLYELVTVFFSQGGSV